jgi:hypothetical protein
MLNNLGSHKARKLTKQPTPSARLLLLPACSHDFNPIETRFANLKTLSERPMREALGPSERTAPCSITSIRRNATPIGRSDTVLLSPRD